MTETELLVLFPTLVATPPVRFVTVTVLLSPLCTVLNSDDTPATDDAKALATASAVLPLPRLLAKTNPIVSRPVNSPDVPVKVTSCDEDVAVTYGPRESFVPFKSLFMLMALAILDAVPLSSPPTYQSVF